MTLSRLPIGALVAVAAVSLGCHQGGMECTQPPAVLTCPDGGGPSFANDVLPNVFGPVCDNCHAPGQVEASIPLTNYNQIYGPASGPNQGSEAKEIFNQVFESCLMPPGNAPVPLDQERRQTLLDWFACGARDSSPADAGASASPAVTGHSG